MGNDSHVIRAPGAWADPLYRPVTRGGTPAMSVRLPVDLRARVADVAGDRPIGSVIREALILWLEVSEDAETETETEAQSA